MTAEPAVALQLAIHRLPGSLIQSPIGNRQSAILNALFVRLRFAEHIRII